MGADGGVCSEIEGKSVMAGKEGRDQVKESFRCQAGGPGPPPEGSAEPWKRVKDMVSQIYIDREGVGSQGRGNQQVWGYSFASWAASEEGQAQESSKPQ